MPRSHALSVLNFDVNQLERATCSGELISTRSPRPSAYLRAFLNSASGVAEITLLDGCDRFLTEAERDLESAVPRREEEEIPLLPQDFELQPILRP
jgi:hypothetical protein